jgi:hypothetical protein
MAKQNLSFEEALKFVQDRRCCVAPNDGFQQQLQLFGNLGYKFSGEKFDGNNNFYN